VSRVPLLALACLLGACQKPPRDELVLWHAYRGAEASALVDAVARFETAPGGVSVRLVSVPYDAFANKLSVAIPRGNGPDVFIYAHDRVGDWAETGLLEPLGLWADERVIDRFFGQTVESLVYEEVLYGLPLAFKTLALFYDTTMVERPPRTTAAMVAQAKAIRAADPTRWGLAYPLDSLYFHAPWLHGFGGRVYSHGDAVALAEPAAVRSVEFVRRLVHDEKIMPEEVTSALVTALFRDHKLAFVVNGPWFRGELDGHRGWAVAPLPIVTETGQPARPFLGVEGVLLNARSTRKVDGFALMRFLTSDGEAMGRLAAGGQLVANTAAYDAGVGDGFTEAFRRQVENAVPLSNRPHMRRVWTPAQDALSQAIMHGVAPAQAMTEAVRVIGRGD
jgi:arabinogalactan oligomer/maltooligosaccharide transport system permease protein